jgi:hypothetical protein
MGYLGPDDIADRAIEPRHVGISVENAFAGELAAGTLVYVSGVNTTTGMRKVTKADANAVPPVQATHIVITAIPQSGFGRVSRSARLINQNTSTWTSAGDAAYLSETAGSITPTAPTAGGSVVQRVGYCIVKSASIGEILIDLTDNVVSSIDTTALLAANNVWTGTNEFGVDGTGVDVTFYGDTATRKIVWDQSADVLRAQDNTSTGWGSGAGTTPDIAIAWDGTDLLVSQLTADSTVKWGVDAAGINHVFYGDTTLVTMTWDQTNDQLLFADNAYLGIGSGAGAAADIRFSWDGTRLNVTQLTANSEIRWGIDGAGIDQILYGDTASANITWDQSADTLILNGVAKIKAQTIAAATGTAIPVTHSGSFPITQNGAETNTLADPTFIGQWLSIFVDTDTAGARVITAASRINQAANTIITLTEVGDFIKLEAITIAGALKWQVVANDGAVLS